MRFLLFNLIWRKEPIWVPDYSPKIFAILVLNLPRYMTLLAFRVFSVFEPIHYPYSQYIHFHSVYSINRYAQWKSVEWFISFSIFPVYMPIHSAYSQYTQNYSVYHQFCIFCECAPQNLNIQNEIFFFRAFKGHHFKKWREGELLGPKTNQDQIVILL